MEKLRSYKEMEPTYAELASALDKLDFENKSTSELFAFYNKRFDAVVVLPLKTGQSKVRKARFAALSSVLAGQGVLQHEFDLGKMIEQYRLQEKKAAA